MKKMAATVARKMATTIPAMALSVSPSGLTFGGIITGGFDGDGVRELLVEDLLVGDNVANTGAAIIGASLTGASEIGLKLGLAVGSPVVTVLTKIPNVSQKYAR